MPLIKPNKGESQDEFISRCMGDDVMVEEYPDQKVRAGICFSQWKEKKEAIDVVEISCSKCGGDRFELEDNHLKCIKCGTLRDKKEINMDTKLNENKIEWRALNLESLEVRAEEGKPVMIIGLAAPFGKLSEVIMDSFQEKIASTAFDETLDGDIRCLFNHEPNYVLGRTTAGTLRLQKDKAGLKFENDPPDTQWAKDLQVSIRRGDVNQMSFAFECLEDSWDKSGEMPIRTLKKVKLQDISIVTYPAYSQTKVGVRGLTEGELVNVLDKYFLPKAEQSLQAPQVLTEGHGNLARLKRQLKVTFLWR